MRHLACVLLLAWSGQAAALSGSDLKSFCDDDKASLQLACLMYIAGVAGGLNLAPAALPGGQEVANDLICTPAGARHLARKQVVESYLEAHPEALALPAEVLVYMSLRQAWPCAGGPG